MLFSRQWYLCVMFLGAMAVSRFFVHVCSQDNSDYLRTKKYSKNRLLARGQRCNYMNAAAASTVGGNKMKDLARRRNPGTTLTQTGGMPSAVVNASNALIYPTWAVGTHLYLLGALKIDNGYTAEQLELPKVIANIRGLLKYWPSYTMIAYVDNASFAYLQSFHDPCVFFIKEKFQHVSRTRRLAFARNMLMNQTDHFIATKQEDPSRTFVVMMDLDHINGYPFHFRFFETAMSETTQWDGLSFFRKWFYDIWALRYGPYDFNALYAPLVNGSSVVPIIQDNIQKAVLDTKLSYFPVISSFNGMAIYKYSYTIGCAYVGTGVREDIEDCEHVAFHKCMIRKHGARIRIYNESISGS